MIPPSTDGSRDQQAPDLAQSLQQSFNVLGILAKTFACLGYVFTRRDFGTHYFGVFPLLVIGILLLFGACGAAQLQTAYFMLTLAWMVAWLLQVWLSVLQPYPLRPHSHYNGFPRVCDWYGLAEENAKRWIEPILVASLSWYVSWLDVRLAVLGCLVAAGMWLDYALLTYVDGRRQQKLRDAQIDQTVMTDDYEQRYGGS